MKERKQINGVTFEYRRLEWYLLTQDGTLIGPYTEKICGEIAAVLPYTIVSLRLYEQEMPYSSLAPQMVGQLELFSAKDHSEKDIIPMTQQRWTTFLAASLPVTQGKLGEPGGPDDNFADSWGNPYLPWPPR